MERIFAEGSPERDSEIERMRADREQALDDRWEYERYVERRSIWDEYQERYEAENAVETPEFRQPVGIQGRLFEEAA